MAAERTLGRPPRPLARGDRAQALRLLGAGRPPEPSAEAPYTRAALRTGGAADGVTGCARAAEPRRAKATVGLGLDHKPAGPESRRTGRRWIPPVPGASVATGLLVSGPLRRPPCPLPAHRPSTTSSAIRSTPPGWRSAGLQASAGWAWAHLSAVPGAGCPLAGGSTERGWRMATSLEAAPLVQRPREISGPAEARSRR